MSGLSTKDGSFNVGAKDSFSALKQCIAGLLKSSWFTFMGIIFLIYVVLNTLFAIAYLINGIEYLHGVRGNTFIENYLEAFF